MADLGAIAQSEFKLSASRVMPVWRFYDTTQNWLNVDVTGTIAVTVTLDGSPSIGSPVCLYYRPNGNFIARTLTNGTGQVTFTGLDAADTGNYFAVAQVEASLNALVYDKL
jgi:hypothetical protein